jgi:hypothetical protein
MNRARPRGRIEYMTTNLVGRKLLWPIGRTTIALAALSAVLLVAGACTTVLTAEPASAPAIIGDEPTIKVHFSQAAIDAGEVSLESLIQQGRLLFTAQFNTLDGAGRPETTGVGDSPFRERREFPDNFNRISGPDAGSCAACHSQPIIGGAGDNVTNIFVDAEIHPFANFDGGEGDAFKVDLTLETVGPERNSVGLFGSGVIEMLSREMSFELQGIRDLALKESRESGSNVTRSLVTKDVDFGTITVHPDGTIDSSGVEGVDSDLIVKPFHQKGAVVSLREFSVKGMNNHHGMQAAERFRDGVDADGDGVVNELTRGDLTAIVAFMVSLPVPGIVMPTDPAALAAAERGEELFAAINCIQCHRTTLRLDSPVFTEPNPFNPPGKLKLSDVSQPLSISLTSETGLTLEPDGSLLVPAFTDLKRHDMGPALDTDAVRQNGIPTEMWLTRKLWGVASEAPFLHHGRATLISEAILLHGGEAEQQRLDYQALSSEDQASVVEFIKTLQILNPSGDQQGPGTATLAADDGPGTALLSVIGGVVGGAVLLLLAAVALSLARRRRGLLS